MLLVNEPTEATGPTETAALLKAAEHLCVAARTAPKGKGLDLLVTAILTDQEKIRLQETMRQIGERDGVPFFLRDADNLEHAPVVVLLGTRKQPLGIPACGFCGFKDCQGMLAAGGTCSFNSGDLGIAVGSAAAMAADYRIDNRIMYTAGKAAIELGLLGDAVEIAYGIPLAARGKNPFFDRQ